MAEFLLIHSPDPRAVRQTIDAAQAGLRELAPEDQIELLEGSGWSLLTARNRFTPYEVVRRGPAAAVVMGLTLAEDKPEILPLVGPASADRARAAALFCRGLNFGLALSVSNRDVIASTDWLGLFPLYCRKSGAGLLLSSLPGLMARSGSSAPRPDAAGLVSLLIMAHCCLDRTIFEGISRLPAGRVLRFQAPDRLGLDRVELGTGPAPPGTLGEAAEEFGAVLSRTVKSAVSADARSVYLSGGMDSRIIAGYLREYCPGRLQAITVGDRRDLEKRAAARVARVLALSPETVPLRLDEFPRYAARAVASDALTGGLYTLLDYAFTDRPRPRVLTGFLGDVTMGASHVGWGWDPKAGTYSFPAMFSSANAWGLAPDLVRELIRTPDIDDVVSGVLRGLEQEFDTYPGPPWQRAWMFDLLHRQRFIVGRSLQVLASKSWPILPFAQAEIISLVGASPLSFVLDRAAEIELILKKFPRLARLPLGRLIDRDWWYLVPPKRRFWTPLLERVRSSLSWHWHHTIDPWEPRVFLRAFDLNGEGWRSLRDEAREAVRGLGDWLNTDLVLKLIPPGREDVPLRRSLVEATGRKALMGAALAGRRYFG